MFIHYHYFGVTKIPFIHQNTFEILRVSLKIDENRAPLDFRGLSSFALENGQGITKMFNLGWMTCEKVSL
jgi:hypothetical protein